jgi:hypothetical protein
LGAAFSHAARGVTLSAEWPTTSCAVPFFVTTQEDAARCTLCEQIAANVMDERVESEAVWYAARAIYFSDIPT